MLYLAFLNLSGQTTDLNKQTKKYTSLSEATKTFFIGGNISTFYSEDFGPQGNVGFSVTPLGTFDINAPLTTSTFSFVFNPYVGIIKTDKVSIGISALFGYDKDVFEDGITMGTFTNPEPLTESRIAFGLGLFYRRHLLTKNRFSLFAQFASQYTREQFTTLPESVSLIRTDTNDIIKVAAELGGKFAFNQNWNLIASLISTDFTATFSLDKDFEFKTHHTSFQFNSVLPNIRFGIERSF